MGGLLLKFGGVAGGLVSGKLLAGMVAGAFMVLSFLLWHAAHDRDTAQKTNRDIGFAVAQVAGVDPGKFGVAQIIPTIRTLGVDRDTARRERDNFRSASDRQSKAVISLSAETARQRLRADEAVKLIRTTTQQRDVWIGRAKAAATRTERMADELELKQTKEVLDALYQQKF